VTFRPHRLALAASVALWTTACGGPRRAAELPVAPTAAPPLAFPFGAEGQADTLGPGIVHARFVVPGTEARGRWAVHLLRADPGICVAAVKAGGGAVGRAPTSALARQLAERDPSVVGAVNGDFFTLAAPAGIPATAHVAGGRVVAGPTRRPVFAVDSAGRPWIGTVQPFGVFVRQGGDTLTVASWNRPDREGVTVFDGGWGTRTDSMPGRLLVRLRPARLFNDYRGGADPGRYRVVSVDSGAATALGALAYVVAVGPAAPDTARARWASLRPGAVGEFALGLFPTPPREAIGGYPVLLRRGAVTADVDTVGPEAFRGPNPRTAVGIMVDGSLLLVTVDGRQPGHSDGTTLRETAELLRALGAVDALNLDGGGSTTMVVRGDGPAPRPGQAPRFAVVNRPSDRTGERPVANALALRACEAR
jgi:hypothetical protein